jgi:adenylate kinase
LEKSGHVHPAGVAVSGQVPPTCHIPTSLFPSPPFRSPLTCSNYADNKIEENITAEIMMTCATETRESYDEEIIVELVSDGSGGDNEVEDNVARLAAWAKQWRSDRESGAHDA